VTAAGRRLQHRALGEGKHSGGHQVSVFDRALKIIARHYADTLLDLAFPDLPVRLVGTVENVELALPARRVDFAHRVEHEGEEYLLHIEFQLKHEAELPRRMHLYHALLGEQFGLPVLSLVLYLQPRQGPLPEAYEVWLGGQVVNRFRYPVLRLWDHVEEIRRGRYRELAPLLTMLVGEPDEGVLEAERALILEEPDPRKRGDLLALAVAIAARYFDKGFLWQFFREEVAMMREASFIEDWIEEGIQKGLQQGLQQGLREGLLAGIELGLELKFGAEGLKLLPEIARIEDPAILRTVHEGLKVVTSPEELRGLYEHLLPDSTSEEAKRP